MKKILFIVPYPLDSAPSQRFRFEQYLPHLEEKGYEITVSSFLDHGTWEVLYRKGYTSRKIKGFTRGVLRRFRDIWVAPDYDLIFIHREAAPFGPPVVEYFLSRILRKKILFDFDDAIWLPNSSEANRLWSWLKMPGKTRSAISSASSVIAGNNYLAAYAGTLNSSVNVIPTTIDFSYHRPTPRVDPGKIRIGWTGSVTTTAHFKSALPWLRELHDKFSNEIEIVMISNQEVKCDFPVTFIPWKKETEVQDLSTIDIGIMPLPDDIWAKGKCGFKGLQYMSLGIPSVMSAVGVNSEIIKDGENGYLIFSEDEWLGKLSRLIQDPALRERLGKAGQETVRQRFSVSSQQQRFVEIFEKLISS